MSTEPRAAAARLTLGPRAWYVAKASYTHARSLAWPLARALGGGRQGVRILFYHRVSDDRDELAVTPRRFEAQMRWLARHGYRVLDVDGVVDSLADGVEPRNLVGLSFDDGYLDVAEHALPVLAAHGFRATVYVVPGAVDGSVSFPWYEPAPTPPLIPWKMLAELDREGTLRAGAHTLTHPNLLALDVDAARREMEGSKQALEQRLERPIASFCYPAGLYGERERQLAIDAGYRSAVSCEPGVNRPGGDPFVLRRTQIDARDRMLDFVAKVQGGHDSSPPLRERYRRRRYSAGSGSPRAASSPR